MSDIIIMEEADCLKIPNEGNAASYKELLALKNEVRALRQKEAFVLAIANEVTKNTSCKFAADLCAQIIKVSK